MATQTFTPNVVARTGKVSTSHGSLSSGDTFTFPNDGNVVLRVANGSSSTATEVTVTTVETVDGQAVSNRKVTVAKESTQYIGPFPPSEFNFEGKVSFTLSATTSVTVEVVSVGR